MATIVVIGKNYSTTLGVIRSLGIAGHEIELLQTGYTDFAQPFLAAKSKYVSKWAYANVKNEENLIETLIKNFGDKNVKKAVFPTDDYNAQTIDKYADELKDLFYFPSIGNEAGKLTSFMDKSIQKNWARKCCISVANGTMIEIVKGTFAIPNTIKYPVITKPSISRGAAKDFIRKCESEDVLVKVLQEIAKKGDNTILVEEYLDIDEEYTITGCANGDNIFIPYVIKKLRTAILHKGVTAVGETIPAYEMKEISDTVTAFMKKLNMTGLFDIEIIKSRDRYYFNEMNLRNGAPLFAITRAGVNLPDLLMQFYLGNDVLCCSEQLSHHFFVSEKAEFDDFNSHKLSIGDFYRDVRNTEYGLINFEEDPAPYSGFKLMVIKSIIKRCLTFLSCNNK